MSEPTPEQKLAALGLALPAVPTPLANYVPYRWAGNLLFFSGQGPKRPDGTFEIGRLGKNATVEDGYRAARLTGLQLLAVAKSAVGELSHIEAGRHARSAVGMGSLPTASWSRSKPFC